MILWLLACIPDPCAVGRVCAVIGSGDAGFNGDGPAREAWLYQPTDVGRLPDGRLAVADYNNYRVRALNADGTLETVAGNGEHAFARPGKSALESPFENPIVFEVGPDGALYIAAEHEGRVLRIRDDLVEVVAGTGNIGFAGDGGDATAAELNAPSGLAFGDDGALYIADSETKRVRVVRDGKIDTIVGGNGELSHPQRLRWDDGRLLIADPGQSRILAFEDGILSDAAPGCDLAYATDARPDADGSLWIADTNHHVVQRYDGTCETVLGDGLPGVLFEDDEDPDGSVLSYPSGIFIEGPDVYVASQGGHQVVRWTRN